MPILNVKVSSPANPELASRISEVLVDTTARLLRKNRELTAVTIDFVPPEFWTVGGRRLLDLGKKSFYFDVKIVEGTNTKDEKSAYIAEIFRAFEALLGDLHPESYVYVQEVKADAYGFGGSTQEFRYIQQQTQQREQREQP